MNQMSELERWKSAKDRFQKQKDSNVHSEESNRVMGLIILDIEKIISNLEKYYENS